MFVAATKEGRPVSARYLNHPKPWVCPVCGWEVRHRGGRHVQPHFAHVPGSSCSHGEGQSPEHYAMKEIVQAWFPNTQLEVPVTPYRRADCLVTTPSGNQFVIECQASAITVDEVEARWRDYTEAGLPVLWMWSRSFFFNPRKAIKWSIDGRSDEYRVCAAMRFINDEGFELCVVDVSTHDIWWCGTEKVDRWDKDGDHYTPETIRRVSFDETLHYDAGSYFEWRYHRRETVSGFFTVFPQPIASDVPAPLLKLLKVGI